MKKIIVKIDKKKCTGIGFCQSVQPTLWKVSNKRAYFLKGTKKNDDTYEIDSNETNIKAIKKSALVCPNYAIKVYNDKNDDILNIKTGQSAKFRIIKSSYNSRKEWKMDKRGFFTIKPFTDEGKIKVRFYNSLHQLECLIEGTNAEYIYNTIIRENFVSLKEHAAYLGSELQKAEIAMKFGLNYIQDEPLDLNKNS